MTIPIKQAQAFAIANDLKQVIIFGHGGTDNPYETHVVTWGETVQDAAQAAAGANLIKKNWGWPEDTIVESAKVQALCDQLDGLTAENDKLIADNAELLKRVEEMELKFRHSPERMAKTTVHVVSGTEHERGWGCRPDGYIAFLTEAAANDWINEYDTTVNCRPTVPHEYTTYSYQGIKECSVEFYREVVKARGQRKHFNRTKDIE